MSEFVGLRLDRELHTAAENYKRANRLDDVSSAIRHMMRRVLEEDGMIGKPNPV